MSTTLIALGVATVLVVLLLVHVFALSLITGAIEFFFGKPKLTFLQSQKGENGFAFSLDFNDSKEPASFDHVKIRLFNPFGKPSQIELAQPFAPQRHSFSQDLDMGPAMGRIKAAEGLDKASVQVEVYAKKDGINHQFDFSARAFLAKLLGAKASLEQEEQEQKVAQTVGPSYATNLPKDMIMDTVPGKGAALKIATNPQFADLFGAPVPGQGGGAAASASSEQAGGGAQEYTVSKVWIAPGCIVCNACEDIYPEVFDVQADTCLIRPDAQKAGSPLLTKGLLIEEAADACPVEVIKFEKA